jgi:predicted TIM-barrel fold metal-dependent hydrolase
MSVIASHRRLSAIALALALGLSTLCASPAPAQEPVFDVHVHLHDGEASVTKYLKAAEELDVKLSGFSAMWFGGGNQALQGHPAEIKAANDKHLNGAKSHPGMIPVVTVHPYDGPAAIKELERVAALGARVLKIHPHTQRFDAADPRVLALVKKAGELNLIVLMDNANIVPGDSEKLFNLALQSPKTTFIFAHIGALNFRFWNILPLARTAENLFAENMYFDISGTSVLLADSPLEDEFVWTLRGVGIDHILFGSDYPQMSVAVSLEALDKLDLTEDEKRKIRFGNAQRLFAIP